MLKTREHHYRSSSPPPTLAATASSSSRLRSASQEKTLHHQVQRPQKKFSLANAFPLTSPLRSHRYRQQKTSGASASVSPRPRFDDGTSAVTNNDTNDKNVTSPQSKFRPRNGSEPQTRKLSAPVDYRDSGVYLGEIDRDPVIEMWNKIRDRDDSISFNKTDDRSEIPRANSKTKNQEIKHESRPRLNSADSSRSLPAVDSPTAHNDLHRSPTCGHVTTSILDQTVEQRSNGRFDDDQMVDSGQHCRTASYRNKHSFSTSALLDSLEISIEAEHKFAFSDSNSPNISGTSQTLSEGASRIDCCILDESRVLTQRNQSLHRRSRSLAGDETTVVNDQPIHFPDPKTDYDTTSARLRERGQLRKSGKTAMVQAYSETDSIACEQKSMAAKKKRSLADPIAKKLTLTFLRRKAAANPSTIPGSTIPAGGRVTNSNANSNLTNSSSSQQGPPKPPSREEVKKWASSFEHLLNHKYGVMLFRLFLQREFSEENVDFWTACEEYKKLRDAKFAANARQIYNDFIAIQAPKEVNLDSVTRSITMAALSNPNRRTFEQAQHRIQSLMEKDSYPRFLRSDLYVDLARKC